MGGDLAERNDPLLRERDIGLAGIDETGLGLVWAGRDSTAVGHVASSGSDSNMAILDCLAIIHGRIMPHFAFPCVQARLTQVLLPEFDPQALPPACVLRRKLFPS